MQHSALGDRHAVQQLVLLIVVPGKKVSVRDIPQYRRSGLPDNELEAGDDARFLVAPGRVPGELEDLGGEVLHHGGHVDGGPGTHPLGVVAFL